ncbi:solute carrier family 35 member C2 isoform 8-T15 [Spheniscus humboldti]
MAGVGGAALGRAALLVLLYYGFSIGIVFYNKWLMKSFPFPLLATLLHLLLIFGLSALARALARCRSGRPRAALSWADCLRWAAPAALSTSLDIGLSNWSFLYVTVSLGWHCCWWFCSSLGGSSCSPTSPHSSTHRGSCWCCVPLSLGVFAGLSRRYLCRRLTWGSRTPLISCFTCSRSCSWGSSHSLRCLREICILFLATHLLGDRLSLLNWLGFAVCLSGISLHVILKAMNSKGEKALKLHKEASSDPDLELLLRHTEHGVPLPPGMKHFLHFLLVP